MVRNETTGHPVCFKRPREDVNAPDLYIPSMAIITYVLVYGMALGQRNEFKPDRLYSSCIKALTILLIELGGLKLGGFILNIANEFALFDFLAILGYGFVGMVCVMLGGLLFGRMGKLLFLLYTSVSTFFFSVHTLLLFL